MSENIHNSDCGSFEQEMKSSLLCSLKESRERATKIEIVQNVPESANSIYDKDDVSNKPDM